MRFRAKNGAIWELITLLRANQTALIASDFKVDVINMNTNFKHINKSYQISPSFINLVVENKEGGEGGLKERWGV